MSSDTTGRPRVLVGASGAAAVLTLPSYLIALRTKLDCQLTVVLSAAAGRFLPARTVRLVADDVIDSTDHDAVFAANHVRLAVEHNLVLALPATANLLADVAHGHAPSLLSTVALASPAPITFVPAMNRSMWTKPAVQRNVALLRDDGHDVVEPQWRTAFELSTRREHENPVLASPGEITDLVAERLTTQ
ncbi:flavoprotein [Salinispora cortesiana]|uniref:flavoprotein n=1 Tax=Salinispora cortesiana TaxID=1305843 RepID=UPI0004256E93|nr:flavoprotein [Salinispora cortesiana]